MKVVRILKRAGLRPTRQRIALGVLIYGDEHRHLTADHLHRQAIETGSPLSLATVYNTLSQFEKAGLIRKISLIRGRAYYDTDPGDHCHCYVEAEDRIIDIPRDRIRFTRLPEPPPGYEISKIDVVIRLIRINDRG
ncbi:MAG: transcriptional repressor [Rhizobiales bacterium]|nr:transcriptional repressor [Hyphomicrobiales bacterium]